MESQIMSSTLPRESIASLQNAVTQESNEEDRLTPRQLEVLRMLVQGKHMKEIGAILNITARTVGFHKYRIMEVLDIKTNADLVRYAVRHHLIDA
jgi:DNA-binding CsgD family transcriptional regulator